MVRSKALWVYFIITASLGFITGGGLLGAASVMLLASGAVADAVLTPKGQPHNQALMYGVSLIFWVAVWAWFKINAPIKQKAPREVSVIRKKSYEIEDPAPFYRPGGYE